ncbi:MAG: YbhB/YbcL family Raf kinase inhibitor-like protein [Rhodospirillales bacterium]|nr:YbhB/YbcL family Raf kinase inhibitor-like protein [Rhodospirillales bacterium]
MMIARSTARPLLRPLSRLVATIAAGLLLSGLPARAATLHVTVDHLHPGGMIAPHYAFCRAAPGNQIAPADNVNPSVSWSKGPPGTRSYAIILTDTDSPAAHRDWMNVPGKMLTAAVKRQSFYHWVLVDIPASVTRIAAGAVSSARVLHGKPASASTIGRPGLNTYTVVTAANPAMKGKYFGYDGPCPPWNDALVHPYHFTVYALSVAHLAVPAGFDGPQALAAMQGKILAEGHFLAHYTTNAAKGAVVAK